MTSRPLTGREYLEQLRARRAAERAGTSSPATTPIDSATQSGVEFGAVPVPEQAGLPPVPLETPTPIGQVTTPEIDPLTEYTSQVTDELQASQFDPNSLSAEDAAAFLADVPKPLPENTIYQWLAKSRPFKNRSQQYFITTGIIVALISLILFFAGQLLTIAVVISVAFLAYVLASVPPDDVQIQLTTYGIRIEKQLYYWDELGRFWFGEKYGQPLFHVEVDRFPFRLTFLLGNADAEKLRVLLSEVLLEQQPEAGAFDKVAEWLQKKIPLEFE